MIGYLGLVAAALFAAVLFVPRLLRPHRVAQQAGTAAVSPARSSPAAGGTAVPVITALPDREDRPPFAYDNGLTIGEGP